MTASALRPAPSPSRLGGPRRAGLARLERPLLAGGLALVTAHLLDLAVSGPDTSWLGVLVIVALPAAWLLVQPRLVRPTRLAAGVVAGLMTFGFAVISHVLHVVNSGADWRDLTGVGMALGGLALVASGLCALAAPAGIRSASRVRQAVHVVGWVAGAYVLAGVAVMPFAGALQITHAPRWEIQESSLAIPHEEVRVPMPDGRSLSAWYVPSRNGAALLLDHGSGGSRERVTAHIRMLARHGYGVLALDLPGNGESEGHSNGLGDNAQPAVAAGLDWLSRRRDVDPDRIAGFGLSLGAEVLIEAAAHDTRLKALVADGATRPQDGDVVSHPSALDRLPIAITMQAVRAVSGMRPSPSLNPIIGRIASRPVLLVASSGFENEIAANRVYQRRGGSNVSLWELRNTPHTGGLRTHPAEYERRVSAFLDRALGT